GGDAAHKDLDGIARGRAVGAAAARIAAQPPAGAVCARTLSLRQPEPLGHDFSLLGAAGADRGDERGRRAPADRAADFGSKKAPEDDRDLGRPVRRACVAAAWTSAAVAP